MATNDEVLDDALSCGVCMERFNETDRLPRLLKCVHSYCQVCMQSLAEVRFFGRGLLA